MRLNKILIDKKEDAKLKTNCNIFHLNVGKNV